MDAVPPDVIQELAPTGVIRAAINLGNPVLAQRPATAGAAPTGISVDLAQELGRRLQRPVVLVTYDAAGKVFEAIATQAWDVAFLAIDPVRAAQILFTAPYVIIEGTYLVRSDAPFQTVQDLDRAGIRIAVGKGAAYDLFLSRSLTQATLVRAETSAAAVDLFQAERLDAAAGVKRPLIDYASAHPGLRVIPGRFTAIEQAIATPTGRTEARAYLQGMIEALKASGFVAAALERSGQRDAVVAPASAGWAGRE